MKQRYVIATTMVLALFASAARPSVPCGAGQGMCPSQAITRAAAAAPYGAPGRYTLVVRSVGRVKGLIYLNSQRDYRDQRNVSVVLYPQAQHQLRARLGGSIAQGLEGHRIAVIGTARRAKTLYLDAHHHATGRYYYQTHIAITRGNQLVKSPSGN